MNYIWLLQWLCLDSCKCRAHKLYISKLKPDVLGFCVSVSVCLSVHKKNKEQKYGEIVKVIRESPVKTWGYLKWKLKGKKRMFHTSDMWWESIWPTKDLVYMLITYFAVLIASQTNKQNRKQKLYYKEWMWILHFQTMCSSQCLAFIPLFEVFMQSCSIVMWNDLTSIISGYKGLGNGKGKNHTRTKKILKYNIHTNACKHEVTPTYTHTHSWFSTQVFTCKAHKINVHEKRNQHKPFYCSVPVAAWLWEKFRNLIFISLKRQSKIQYFTQRHTVWAENGSMSSAMCRGYIFADCHGSFL